MKRFKIRNYFETSVKYQATGRIILSMPSVKYSNTNRAAQAVAAVTYSFAALRFLQGCVAQDLYTSRNYIAGSSPEDTSRNNDAFSQVHHGTGRVGTARTDSQFPQTQPLREKQLDIVTKAPGEVAQQAAPENRAESQQGGQQQTQPVNAAKHIHQATQTRTSSIQLDAPTDGSDSKPSRSASKDAQPDDKPGVEKKDASTSTSIRVITWEGTLHQKHGTSLRFNLNNCSVKLELRSDWSDEEYGEIQEQLYHVDDILQVLGGKQSQPETTFETPPQSSKSDEVQHNDQKIQEQLLEIQKNNQIIEQQKHSIQQNHDQLQQLGVQIQQTSNDQSTSPTQVNNAAGGAPSTTENKQDLKTFLTDKLEGVPEISEEKIASLVRILKLAFNVKDVETLKTKIEEHAIVAKPPVVTEDMIKALRDAFGVLEPSGGGGGGRQPKQPKVQIKKEEMNVFLQCAFEKFADKLKTNCVKTDTGKLDPGGVDFQETFKIDIQQFQVDQFNILRDNGFKTLQRISKEVEQRILKKLTQKPRLHAEQKPPEPNQVRMDNPTSFQRNDSRT